MKETPIPMSTEMVQAYLEGRKGMIRRTRGLVKFNESPNDWVVHHISGAEWEFKNIKTLADYHILCPFGQVGSKLWVKEALIHSSIGVPTRYAADGCPVMRDGQSIYWPFRKDFLPALWMPRWASRINLEITGERVERLQEITLEDCWDEGSQGRAEERIPEYRKLWDSLNAKKGDGWEKNCWVWVIEFPKLIRE